MLRKLLLVLGALACLAIPAKAQIGTINNPAIAILTAQDSGTCSAANGSLIQQLPTNAGTTTVTLAGTFSATVTIRRSNNGGATWVTANTLSATGTTSYSTAGYTHLCADVTAYTSGAVSVAISTGTGGGSGAQAVTTVSGLSSFAAKGNIAVVTDGSTGTDCTVGGGTTLVACLYNGTTWGQLPAASAGATAFSAITGATNAAALVMGTGGSLGTSGTGTIAATSLEAKTWEAPGTIGSTTPNTGAFSTVSLTGQLTSTLATGTAPFSVASTTPVANLSIGGNAATATSATNSLGLTFGVTSIPLSATAPTANQCLAADGTAANIIGVTCGSGGGGLSGMTAGQIPVAATATTVTSSLPLAGGGTQVMEGTIGSNPTNGLDILGLNSSGVLVNETPGITGTDQAGTTYTIQTTDIGTTFNIGNSAGTTVTVPDAGTCSNGTLPSCTSGGSAFSAHPYFTAINNSTGSDVFSSPTLASPAAPSVSAGGSGGPGAATYITYATYVNPQGETLVSSSTSKTTTSGQVITVTSPSASGNASGYNVYSTTGAAGTETRQNATPINIGTNWTEPNTGLIAGSAIPSSNTTNSQFCNAGTCASSYTLAAGAHATFAGRDNVTWTVIPSGTGGGTTVSVNGSNVSTPNFNSSTPASPANNQNAIFNVSGSNVAVELPQATTSQLGLVELANSLGGSASAPTVGALDFGASHLALGAAPSTNQCLSYNGTNITGSSCSGASLTTVPADFNVSGGGATLGRPAPTTVTTAANCGTTTVVVGGTYIYTGTTTGCNWSLPAIGATPNATDPTCFIDQTTAAFGSDSVAATNSNTINGSAANAKASMGAGQKMCLVQDSTTDWLISRPVNFYYMNYGLTINQFPAAVSITSDTFATPTVTVTATGTYFVGQWVKIVGGTGGNHSGTFQVTATGSGTFSYADASGAACASTCGTVQSQDVPLGTSGAPTFVMSNTIPGPGSNIWNPGSGGNSYDMGVTGTIELYNTGGSSATVWIYMAMWGNTYTTSQCFTDVTVPAGAIVDTPISCEAFKNGTIALANLAQSTYAAASASGVYAKFRYQNAPPTTLPGGSVWATVENITVNGP